MMTFNLVKGILGSGILALPAGIATMTTSNSAAVLLPAVLLLVLTGSASAYGFALIGLVCDATGAKTYKEAWNESVGRAAPDSVSVRSKSLPPRTTPVSKTSWMPAVACLAVTFCTTLTYTMVLADMIPQLIPVKMSRRTSLISLAAVLAPICMLQELKKLAPVSIVGLLGTVYTALAMVWRWYQHSVERRGLVSEGIDVSAMFSSLQSPAIFMSMLSTSFMAHYNAPRVYWELRGERQNSKGASSPCHDGSSPASVSNFVKVVRYGFGTATAVMAVIASSGFAVFGRSSASNILSSYSLTDPLMTVGRAAIAISLICTFPLAFVGIRNQFLELAGLRRDSQSVITATTFGLLSVLLFVAYFVRDLRIVLAIGGQSPFVLNRRTRQELFEFVVCPASCLIPSRSFAKT
jgi:amino acid permease